MKSYTDIEQSKKLAEILPIESADMYYRNNGIDAKLMWEHNTPEVKYPCWSLAALLEILYYPQLSKDKLGGGKEGWMVSVYQNDCRYDSCWHDNPVDACYDMVLRLHELNLL